ncbi:hypothetical protein E4U32_006975 [Claviceps aff. humidiphila group G2b]|nr:hypothetical protein E4U32_006975 [Claviceps aff. humidiphila group G2b]
MGFIDTDSPLAMRVVSTVFPRRALSWLWGIQLLLSAETSRRVIFAITVAIYHPINVPSASSIKSSRDALLVIARVFSGSTYVVHQTLSGPFTLNNNSNNDNKLTITMTMMKTTIRPRKDDYERYDNTDTTATTTTIEAKCIDEHLI